MINPEEIPDDGSLISYICSDAAAQSAIFTPSDIPFTRDAIRSEATPNTEMVIVDDVDLELLKRHRQSGNVLNWMDRRDDLYEIRYKAENSISIL